MLSRLSSKAQGRIIFWKQSKPCHVGIHWKALTELSHMSTHSQVFWSFFRLLHHFALVKFDTASIKVREYFRNALLCGIQTKSHVHVTLAFSVVWRISTQDEVDLHTNFPAFNVKPWSKGYTPILQYQTSSKIHFIILRTVFLPAKERISYLHCVDDFTCPLTKKQF